MKYNFNIEKIVLACFVAKGAGEMTHRNRASHGLAFHTSGVKRYVFDTGSSFTVCKNDIVYLPKYSSYNVSSVESGECYAINFELSDEACFEPFVMSKKVASGGLGTL